MADSVLLHFDRDAQAAGALGGLLGLPCVMLERHRFPDGEFRLRVPELPAACAVVFATLDDPNEKLVELMILAGCLRELGVSRIVLLAPYLCYMRQDIAFTPGEAVSQRIVGRFLAERFDALITVDPHLHRISSLEQAVPLDDAIALSAAPAIGEFLARERPGALLLGPDGESAAWVSAAAQQAGLQHAVASKVRSGDREVQIVLPEVELAGRQVVLIDDMASTGRTLALAARLVLQAGASRVDAAVTHALFFDDALQVMRDAGVREIWSSDSIVHPSNRIALAPMLAASLVPVLSRLKSSR